MSLYHEAASAIVALTNESASLKSIIFGKKAWKSDPKTLYALTSEAVKWSEVLSEVIENSNLLKLDKKLTPTLALLLTHDLLLARKGVALPATHGLHAGIARHKARLSSELTKSRIRRGCTSIEALRALVERGSAQSTHPRWVRINTLRTTLTAQLETTLSSYTRTEGLSEVAAPTSVDKLFYLDDHIPDLIGVSLNSDLTKTSAYREGLLIMQDKASCFPAYLLNPSELNGDIIDACAAPGNKTTHVAALLSFTSQNESQDTPKSKVFACERDPIRSQTLSKMIKVAGASDIVSVRTNQDFLKLNPHAKQFSNVRSLLLDPSCSGSGIIGRDEATVTIHLPSTTKPDDPAQRGKKRKRPDPNPPGQAKVDLEATQPITRLQNEEQEQTPEFEEADSHKLATRLTALADFQLRLLQHAMAFPAARRITYSTCSVHDEENESVVVRALLSNIAVERGWRVMKRRAQVDGLRKWSTRGSKEAVKTAYGNSSSEFEVDEVADACLRCSKDGEEGTMGFFVAGFVRTGETPDKPRDALENRTNGDGAVGTSGVDGDEEEWGGFSDDGIT